MSAIIVQSDRSVLLEVAAPGADQARELLGRCAHLVRAPEHVHTYQLTELDLWNARAAGVDAETVIHGLLEHARYPINHEILVWIADTMARFGEVTLEEHAQHGLVLTGKPAIVAEIQHSEHTAGLVGAAVAEDMLSLPVANRGEIKRQLLKLGWPAEDRAPVLDGTPLAVIPTDDWQLRPYQSQAVGAFTDPGNGVVVLPCGAGKTVVGISAMAATSATTLILVSNTVSARQWRDEILARTHLRPEDVGEYSGERKQIRPVTIATYQVLTTRRDHHYLHLQLLDDHDWGLIIYDEVHLLPAPVFRRTAHLQARRRLGLTATLIREDGLEHDVFSLIGPKRFDVPWKQLESAGFIAPAECTEVRVPLPEEDQAAYGLARKSTAYAFAAGHEIKIPVVENLVAEHAGEQILVIGQYLEQLEAIATALDAPLITGATPNAQREVLFEAFRAGEIQVLVVSKVANFSINLPEASVAIQVSGAFGSRQEEAQRLGRLMRPKADGRRAQFFTVVTANTADQAFAAQRQRFLTEQGYPYRITRAEGYAR